MFFSAAHREKLGALLFFMRQKKYLIKKKEGKKKEEKREEISESCDPVCIYPHLQRHMGTYIDCAGTECPCDCVPGGLW